MKETKVYLVYAIDCPYCETPQGVYFDNDIEKINRKMQCFSCEEEFLVIEDDKLQKIKNQL